VKAVIGLLILAAVTMLGAAAELSGMETAGWPNGGKEI
jgi:hypothetical protein